MPTTPVLWKDLIQVNTNDGGTIQANAQVAALPDGGYVVVWVDESGVHNPNGSAIAGQLYNALGEKVGGEVDFGRASSGGDELHPAVTVLSNGNIAVAFSDHFTPPGMEFKDIYVRIYGPSLNLIRQDVIEFDPGLTSNPSLVALADGGYAVTYTRAVSTDDYDVVARIVDGNGTIVPEFEPVNFPETDKQDNAEVAKLSNGSFVVVFEDEFDVPPGAPNQGSNNIAFRILKPNGSPDSFPLLVTGDENTDDTAPGVAGLTGGGFAVVWTRAGGDGSGTGIKLHVLNNAGENVLSQWVDVNSTTTGNQNDATVVALADGGFLVAWEDDNANVGRGQRFDALGNKIGSEFTLNNSVVFANSETPLRMTLLADGRVAFVANAFDGADYDVVTSIWDPRGGPTAVAVNPTVASIAEDASTAAAVKVADIAVTDDGEGTNLLSVTGADAAFFEIVGTELFLKAGTGLDFETKVSYAVAVQVDDPAVGGASIEATSAIYTLTVTDVTPETVTGTTGSDTLTGTSDADSFVFNTALNKKANVDTIVGFVVLDDSIHLDNAIFAKLKKDGVLKAKYFEVGKKADDEDDFIVYNKKTGDLFYDKNGDHKGGAVLFAVIEGSPDDLSKADFFVI